MCGLIVVERVVDDTGDAIALSPPGNTRRSQQQCGSLVRLCVAILVTVVGSCACAGDADKSCEPVTRTQPDLGRDQHILERARSAAAALGWDVDHSQFVIDEGGTQWRRLLDTPGGRRILFKNPPVQDIVCGGAYAVVLVDMIGAAANSTMIDGGGIVFVDLSSERSCAVWRP